MGIKSKLGLTDDSVLSSESQEYLNKLIREVINRSNKERDTAIANLRIEVSNLTNQVKALSDRVELLLPIAKLSVIEEINQLNSEILSIKREKCYKKFFSGDGGFLFQLPEILSGICKLEKESSDINDIRKFYAKNFYPISNGIIVLEGSINNINDDSQLFILSFDQLIEKRNILNKTIEESRSSFSTQFYGNLWRAIAGPITELCDSRYEDGFSIKNCQFIKKELMEAIYDIAKELTRNGIEIIYEPTEECKDSFMKPANPGIPSKPLIRRAHDKYIYSYGIFNENMPLYNG